MIYVSNIIFDLDGTLIDSAPSIIETLSQTLKLFSYSPVEPLMPSMIGPPLRETLSAISGEVNPQRLVELEEAFKKIYDCHAFALSRPYPGIEEVLNTLYSENICMHIATNKRFIPTVKIIEYLGWTKYFHTINSLDAISPRYQNKSQMLKAMVNTLQLINSSCIYIGDRLEDAIAANENELKFIYAGWGYGPSTVTVNNFQFIKNPNELIYSLGFYD